MHMLQLLTVVTMVLVGFVYLREGLFRAVVMCGSVLLAGLVTFNFWEPLADWLESHTGVGPYSDAVCLIALFVLTLGALRVATMALVPMRVAYHPAAQLAGGGLVGMVVGYLLTGFLVCVFQTLPWDRDFLGFEPADSTETSDRVLPPDVVWLSLMHHAGAYPFANRADENVDEPGAPRDKRYQTFDQGGSFERRYARFRRYDDKGERETYQQEYDQELHRQ
jgi:hypothetical protein